MAFVSNQPKEGLVSVADWSRDLNNKNQCFFDFENQRETKIEMEYKTESQPHELSPRRLFAWGFVFTLLFFAACTAVSWFARSSSWGELFGYADSASGQAIGFPFEFWRIGQSFRGWLINYPVFGLNVLIAVGAGVAIGWMAARFADFFQDRIGEMGHASARESAGATFSIRGLMFLTTLIAGSLGLGQMLGATPLSLSLILLGGPLVLMLIAMFPAKLHWDQRAWIIVGTAVILIAFAVAIGNTLSMTFDRVLFGIFICWVPQSVVAAIVLLVGSLIFGKGAERYEKCR